jgi:hypothetical protein
MILLCEGGFVTEEAWRGGNSPAPLALIAARQRPPGSRMTPGHHAAVRASISATDPPALLDSLLGRSPG